MGNRQLETYRVSGHSMYPLLRDGQEIQVEKAGRYKVGDIVVATHPIQTDLTIVKRVAAIENGRFRLRGESGAESTDKFGLVPPERILGKVLL